MATIRGITLDFYGTLVEEDDAGVRRICEEICERSPTHPTPEAVGAYWWEHLSWFYKHAHHDTFVTELEASIRSLTATVQLFGADIDPVETIVRQSERWMSPRTYDDTHGFLDWINSRGIPVCLVSNVDTEILEHALAFTNLHFDRIVTSEDVRAYKPRPEIMKRALSYLNTAAGETLHIGDSRTNDLAGARSVSTMFAWLNRVGKPAINDPAMTLTATSLIELQRTLENSGMLER